MVTTQMGRYGIYTLTAVGDPGMVVYNLAGESFGELGDPPKYFILAD